MEVITYRGAAAAIVVDRDLAMFEPSLEARGWDDPVFRFVAVMCLLAIEIERGLVGGRYDDERTEGHAREALMPRDCFAALAALPDAYRRPASASRPSRSPLGALSWGWPRSTAAPTAGPPEPGSRAREKKTHPQP